MNRSNSRLIPVLYLIFGLVGCLLYQQIFKGVPEGSQLIARGTLPEILLWILTAVAFLGAIVFGRKCTLQDSGAVFSIIGNAALLVGVYSLLQIDPKGPAALVKVYQGIAWACMACLAAGAVMRVLKKKPHFVLELLPCLMCIMQLMECYQLWSEKPLLLHYCFGVGAVLCLMLYAYHNLAASAGLPAKAVHPFVGLFGIFCCCIAALQVDFPVFFAAGAVWILSGMANFSLAAAEE